jgi:hypothetical protein
LCSGTEDISFFLDTVEDAGVPANTPIAYLNDPERQTALAHLRKMMMVRVLSCNLFPLFKLFNFTKM